MPHSPTNPFGSARRRLRRAEAHIHNLKLRVGAYIDRHPYCLAIDIDSKGIHQIHKLRAKRKVLPASFSDISTDALENLRAALDHAVFPIFEKYGTPEPNAVYFPFCSLASEVPKRITKMCPTCPKDIINFLESFKPYKGGNDTLCALNKLVRISKHKSLTNVAFSISDTRIHHTEGFIKLFSPPIWDSANNEFIIGVADGRKKTAFYGGFKFEIGFKEIPVLAGKPIVGVLHDMAGIVNRVIAGLEAESRRIGLFP